MPQNIDLIGQINREQAIKTLKRAGLAAMIGVLIVVETDLPHIIDATAPLGIFIAFAAAQARKFLESGSTIEIVKDK